MHDMAARFEFEARITLPEVENALQNELGFDGNGIGAAHDFVEQATRQSAEMLVGAAGHGGIVIFELLLVGERS